MKRVLVIILASLFVAIGLFLLTRVIFSVGPKGKGALQVQANVKSTVYLNDKPIGQTPLCKCNAGETLNTGDYTVKVVPTDSTLEPFTTKVEIEPNVLTAVERTFLPGSLASAYTLTLQKNNKNEPELFVTSIPEGARVLIDGNEENVTPYTSENITASEHEIEIQKDKFSKKTIRVRTVAGYKLIVNAVLGTSSDTVEEQFKAPTPTLSVSVSPTGPAKTANTITILDTQTGFLRVRRGPSTGTAEIGRVTPGDTFVLLDEENGWYQIKLTSGDTGWVSGQFAKKSTDAE